MGQKFIIQGGNKVPITQVPINKVSFGTPFAGNSVNKTLSPAELVRALRFAIAAEYEAIQLYEQIAEATDYTPAGVALMSIAREEKVHAGELLEVLKTLDPEEKITYEEGEEETKEIVGKCRKMLKGGPGSGRKPEGGRQDQSLDPHKYDKQNLRNATARAKYRGIQTGYHPKTYGERADEKIVDASEKQNAIDRDAVYEEDKSNPKDYHPEHPDNV
jgi:rubrerythrin